MKRISALFLFLFSLISFDSTSQVKPTDEKEKITKSLIDYFALDRENIHLQLNKSTYINNEEIWLKGYIIEKKNHKPFSRTSNVYVSLIDNKGVNLKTNLYYAENSTFDGKYKLEETYPTGIYYLQVYTNYMNNFTEDESSVYKINIINPAENNYIENTKINYETAKMEFFPESGVFLEGTSNVIGVKIMDCNDNGIEVINAEVFDAKGILITNFSTNNFGFGRFEILSTNNEKYKVVYNLKNEKQETEMPLPVLKGIIFSVNNYILPNKTSIKLKTNSRTLSEIKADDYMFVFHKTNESSFLDVSFKDEKLEQNFIMSNDQFSDGINAITLIDKNKNKVAERNIYQHTTFKNKLDLSILKKTNDSISISGISNIPLSELSISIIPTVSECDIFEKNIVNSFDFDANLKTPFKNGSYYISDTNRRKQVELDNILICEESKYEWNKILNIPNVEKHEFDIGLTVTGTVNNTIVKKENFKVKMTSILQGINQTATLNDKNEFSFANVVAIDSTQIHFSLLSKNDKLDNLKLYSQISKNNRKFLKAYQIVSKNCEIISKENEAISNIYPSVIKKSILLDTISLKGGYKKPKLKNELQFNNGMAKGYKITDDVARSYYDVLSFIGSHGYDIRYDGGNVNIINRTSNSFNGTKIPLLFINDLPETNTNFLVGMNLNTIDEIYINKRGYGGGDGANNGIIRIYTKKVIGADKKIEIKSKSLLVKNGFQPYVNFKNPKYTKYNDDGFNRFGTIHWEPKILIDQNGNFNFSIPNFYQESVKIIIEGISSEGQLISETRVLKI